jgi:hypothetical protein
MPIGLSAGSVDASTSPVHLVRMVETVLSEDFGKRSASLYFSRMRVAKAASFRASISSTSHITIVVLIIVDPFRNSIAFISEYLCHECTIPLVRSAVA